MIRAVYVDLETGGLNPDKDAVTEIGAVAFDMDDMGAFSLIDTFHAYVIPDPRMSLSLKALNIQGVDSWQAFTERQEEAVTEKDALTAFMDFLTDNLGSGVEDGWHPRIWAHNAEFDYAFLRNLASRVPGTAGIFPYRPEWNCTKYLYRVAVWSKRLPDQGSTSLDALCKQFSVERPAAHDAKADAIAGAKCLTGLWKALQGR